MLALDEYAHRENFVIAKERKINAHFVVGKNSPLAGRKGLKMQDLLEMPFILTESMGYRRSLDDVLAQKGIHLKPVLEIGRTDLIVATLSGGRGVSFLPDFITRKEREKGNIVCLDVADVTVEIHQQLIHHKSKWISRALRAFIDYVCEHEFNRE